MIEITSVIASEQRFLGIRMYLPKCTMNLLFNMNLIIFDQHFDMTLIEKKCPIPMIQCKSISFDSVSHQMIMKCSGHACRHGIMTSMSVKEAIACVFSQKETS